MRDASKRTKRRKGSPKSEWRFAKYDPHGKCVLVTAYTVDEAHVEIFLKTFQERDHLAIEKGYRWEKIPADAKVKWKHEFEATKVWTSKTMKDIKHG